MRNIDEIIDNLNLLKEQYIECGHDEECEWWIDEYGSNLVWQIDCHPTFVDGTPCLNEVSNHVYGTHDWYDTCQECKAKWLMEEFE